MVSVLLSLVNILLLGAASCDKKLPKLPENITIAIIHILEKDDFSKAVTPVVTGSGEPGRRKRSAGLGYVPTQTISRQGFGVPVTGSVDYVTSSIPVQVANPVNDYVVPTVRQTLTNPVTEVFPEPIVPPFYPYIPGNNQNGALGTSGTINTRFLGQGPYGSYVNNGAVTNEIGGPVSNYGTIGRVNNGRVTNFINCFTPGGLSLRSGEITRDYYVQGGYDNALTYFRSLNPVQVTTLTNGYQGYNGMYYTTARNSYSLNVCRDCYDGLSGIAVRSNVEPYSFLERRFMFAPDFNANVYRSTGCVTSCN